MRPHVTIEKPHLRVLPWVLGGAVLIVGLAVVSHPPQASWKALFVLSILVALGELWSVPVTRFGLKLGFAPPFLAALFVFGGFGLTFSVALTAAVGTAILSARPLNTTTKEIIPLMLRCVSYLAAGALAAQVGQLFFPMSLSHGGIALLFLIGYGLANLLGIALDRGIAQPRFSLELLKTMVPVWLILLIHFSLVAFVAVDLVVRNWLPMLPLLVIAVLVLRSVVVIRNRHDDQFHQMVLALSLMMQRAHPYTRGHLERVGRWCYDVGLRMGLSLPTAHRLQQAAILHDIGKIAIDETILDLPIRLSVDQYKHVQLHAELGAEILEASAAFRSMGKWIRAHHERPDGAGYPHGLRDIEIPLASKVIAVADAYDAMVGNEDPDSARRYRPPLSPPEAIAELERCSPDQFDPEVVKTFREVVFTGRRFSAL